jgi:hypothetical protein
MQNEQGKVAEQKDCLGITFAKFMTSPATFVRIFAVSRSASADFRAIPRRDGYLLGELDALARRSLPLRPSFGGRLFAFHA